MGNMLNSYESKVTIKKKKQFLNISQRSLFNYFSLGFGEEKKKKKKIHAFCEVHPIAQ